MAAPRECRARVLARRITPCADVAPGIGSASFRALAAGAEVVFKGPLGGFVFGVVPMRSMLTHLSVPVAGLASAVESLVDAVDGLVAYVAGGEATIPRVREVLMAKGLERRAVRWEKFW